MDNLLFSLPVAFIVVLAACFLFSYLFSKISFRSKSRNDGQGQPYACGENNYDHMAQPDYSTFFPFAFFFTIAHVATLIMTTAPVEITRIFILVFLYISGTVIGLYVLLRS